ncbi:hypothetical protein BC332_32536 [Capsicum chinense]|nr:hypothetical protein BC332_32536 [Capsicum chinense]
MERGKGKEANSSSVSSAVIRKDIAKIFDFIEKLNDEGVQIPFQIEKLASELTFVSAFFLRYYYLDSEGRNGESMSFLSIAIHDLAQSLFRWSGVHMLIKLKHHDILQLLENITSYISSHSYAESSHMTMTEDRLAELLDVIVMYLRYLPKCFPVLFLPSITQYEFLQNVCGNVDKRFDDIKALMKKHHEEMKKQHEEMMLAVKEYHDAPQKNEKDGNDLRTPNEQPNDISEKNDDGNAGSTGDHKRDEKLSTESSLKLNFDDPAIPTETIEVQNESETDITNIAFQHSIDNTIAEIFSPVSAIQSDDLLQKGNLPDLILPTDNIEVRNESHVSSTEISSDAFQELIDNIIAGMSTSVVAMTLNSNDLAEKVNLPDPFL